MVGSGKLVQAMTEYDELLAILPQVENELSAKILHNKAVAMTGLFLFEQASEVFLQSYEMLPLQETYIEYLAAKRLSMSDNDYVAFIASIPEAYDDSIELEKRVEEIAQTWADNMTIQRIEQLKAWKQVGDFAQYYEETDKIIHALKHGYRYSIGES